MCKHDKIYLQGAFIVSERFWCGFFSVDRYI